MRYVISLLMENQAGALSRVVGLFSQRGYNIETLNVAPTDDHTLSRLTLTTDGDEKTVGQICLHLRRLVDVYRVRIMNEDAVRCELILVKLRVDGDEEREKVRAGLKGFDAHVIDSADNVCVVALNGDADDLGSFLSLVDVSRVLEIAHSGVVALSNDDSVLVKSS